MAALQGFKYGARLAARVLRATADRLDPPEAITITIWHFGSDELARQVAERVNGRG